MSVGWMTVVLLPWLGLDESRIDGDDARSEHVPGLNMERNRLRKGDEFYCACVAPDENAGVGAQGDAWVEVLDLGVISPKLGAATARTSEGIQGDEEKRRAVGWHGETSAFQVHMLAMEEVPELDAWKPMRMRHCYEPEGHH